MAGCLVLVSGGLLALGPMNDRAAQKAQRDHLKRRLALDWIKTAGRSAGAASRTVKRSGDSITVNRLDPNGWAVTSRPRTILRAGSLPG